MCGDLMSGIQIRAKMFDISQRGSEKVGECVQN